ncbi:heparan sulfate glucosamine 3-O-sulfotransferase 1-like [Mercenaria mercenaria]|uniref:heparan sulfate glucosamine 3-O-sulfotransferase 1-like n=1 Tax=Mercenaria mercenaria TaxID=6596 RepID=UPI00234EB9A7|nr:heparan sulfate glucosamine 3-O-sulfotransferase 1-like [Mercenaria mercenaria]
MVEGLKNVTEEVRSSNKGSKELHLAENVGLATKEKCHKRLPQVIIAGHYKSGTGALTKFLNEHPQIFACLESGDIQFFNKFYISRGFRWYRNIMPCTFKTQITIEKTAHYFLHPKAGLRIHDMNPKPKIIIILKDPVTVAASLYAMWREHKHYKANEYLFERMVTMFEGTTLQINPFSRIIQMCSYVVPMQRWINLFNRTQLLILDGNSFDKHPLGSLMKVEQFLDVKHFFNMEQFVYNFTKGKYCFRRANKTVLCLPKGKGRPHPEISAEVVQMLTDYFKPITKRLFEIINQTFPW